MSQGILIFRMRFVSRKHLQKFSFSSSSGRARRSGVRWRHFLLRSLYPWRLLYFSSSIVPSEFDDLLRQKLTRWDFPWLLIIIVEDHIKFLLFVLRSPFKLLLLYNNPFLELGFSILFLFFPSLSLNRLKFLLLPLQLLLYVKLQFLFKPFLGRNYPSLQHSSLKIKITGVLLKFLVLGIGQTLTVEVLVEVLE